MKLIKPYFEIIEQEPGLEGIYKQIELAGRTCYKSEDKITPDSAKGFVDRMIKSGHGAMLEHGTVYLKVLHRDANTIFGNWVTDQYMSNPYSNINFDYNGDYMITTNLRVIVENNWLDDLEYIYEPTEHHEKRVTVRFICDRGVSHEFVRHRVFSFAQESTRYCNYSKDKFGNELTFIIPCWLDIKPFSYSTDIMSGAQIKKAKETDPSLNFIQGLANSELQYFELLDKGWLPQQARAVLPNALKTELVMTGFISDWKHFFELRCDKAAHPQARELAIPLQEEFVKRGYLNE